MLSSLRSTIVIFGAGLATAGCAVDVFTYTLSRYGEVQGVRVRLGCDDTYEVFDRRDAARFVIVTNGVNEALSSCAEGSASSREARMSRIAKIYLDETSARPQCRIVSQTELTPLHTEIAYRCGAAETAKVARKR